MIHCIINSRTSRSNQKTKRRAMATHLATVFVAFISLYQTDPVIGCTVGPSAAAVLAGNSISVNCTPIGEEYVAQWWRQNETRKVYEAPTPNKNRFVAGGYSVNDTNPKEIILTLQNASIQSADNYVCICFNAPTVSRDYTYISVIKTEPQFNATDGLSNDDPLNFTCSLEFAGNATLLMQITNSAGNVFAELNQRIITNVSQQFNLYYSISIAIEKIYFCNISLTSDASDPKITIFSRNLTTTVQFSARNVFISPENPERCHSDGLCQTGSVILCKAEGNPEPSYTFTIYRNVTIESSKDTYTVKTVGQQVIQCTASNMINGNVYYSQSINFTTNVTEGSVGPNNGDGVNVPLIVGLVVGLGGGIILIIIIIIIFCYLNRQKRRTACCNLEQSSEPRSEHTVETNTTKGNKGNKGTAINGQTNLAATSGNERVLFENTLYSGSGSKGDVTYNSTIDPSDGGYAAINELGTSRKG